MFGRLTSALIRKSSCHDCRILRVLYGKTIHPTIHIAESFVRQNDLLLPVAHAPDPGPGIGTQMQHSGVACYWHIHSNATLES